MSDAPAIYTALAAVMDEVKAVAKRDHNDFQNFNFRGIDAVVNAVGPALREHDVVVVPQVRSVDYADVQTSNGKPATACRILVTYAFYAADGSHVEATVAGEAWDSGDKACPKAMSVALRTALLQALALPTDEPDPDSQTYERAPDPEPVDELTKLRRTIRSKAKKQNLTTAMVGYLADRYETNSLDDLDQAQLLEIAADLNASSGRAAIEAYMSEGVPADV